MRLSGPINAVKEAECKYDLTLEILKQKTSVQNCSLSNATTATDHYNLMISYCYSDKDVCHPLADRLMSDGFTLWIDRDKTLTESVTRKAIDQSDCVLLCLSEEYYTNVNCQNEAKYAHQTSGKVMIPAKVNNYVMKNWLTSTIRTTKTIFKLFGSDDNFNLEYDKLIVEISRYTKSGIATTIITSAAATEQKETTFFFKIDKDEEEIQKEVRKLNCQKNLEIQRAREKDFNDKDRILLEEIIQEYSDLALNGDVHKHDKNSYSSLLLQPSQSSLLCIQNWLKNPPSVTMGNIAPFSTTGDVNDAAFQLPDHISKNLDDLRDYTNSTKISRKNQEKFITDIIDGEYVWTAPIESGTVLNMTHAENDDYFQKLVSRNHQSTFKTHINEADYVWTTVDGKIGTEMKSEDEMRRRTELDDPTKMVKRRLQLAKYFIDKTRISSKRKRFQYTKEDLEPYLKFAYQMKKNAEEMEFCEFQQYQLIKRSTVTNMTALWMFIPDRKASKPVKSLQIKFS
ncbi:unnamed protein product [Didymodactylos carnosus]|uniref:TIR domain-containing protein n=1 Tax=Didymodactylos carnosus TaxID=1234261 RepID=A0A814R8Z4_9BILA|nr:unnamed protein product [Didymodactylos carnosus]CAF1128859.1 unnamed protein product [Didymodactylos carnosus]CAF3674967.1 unnamed protein product [Didymodactylos carnosus]CAF3892456.1 unnamed protein product [Didymodactylos carnosus]